MLLCFLFYFDSVVSLSFSVVCFLFLFSFSKSQAMSGLPTQKCKDGKTGGAVVNRKVAGSNPRPSTCASSCAVCTRAQLLVPSPPLTTAAEGSAGWLPRQHFVYSSASRRRSRPFLRPSLPPSLPPAGRLVSVMCYQPGCRRCPAHLSPAWLGPARPGSAHRRSLRPLRAAILSSTFGT